MPESLLREGNAVTVRLYTKCALALTASAVAGLLVGGFIAIAADRAPEQPVTTQVSHVTSDAGGQ
ncbi:hypothetical protein [Saccharopolyspora sp. 5N708]|uniref:hypothetical protein n=1 Tax=Saccharopolyspora sp. 5N708 TaxID=3457424 RepID=UPI003FD22D62